MTNEMIQAITSAEERALQIKNQASEQAEVVLSTAQAQAESLRRSSEDVLKAYKDTQLAQAKKQAEENYTKEIAKAKKEAQSYCAEVIKNADAVITDIVGRIVSGNR